MEEQECCNHMSPRKQWSQTLQEKAEHPKGVLQPQHD